ncbi:hypothetical protein TNCV_92721 [Trichonephila clavipes]|nr:hypothetical protein TNCV_92721 [Trichonephila clavipes]
MPNNKNCGLNSSHCRGVVVWTRVPAQVSTSSFERSSELQGRIITYRNCGLSYRVIAARVDRYPITISRIWNRWVQDSNTECRSPDLHIPQISRLQKMSGKWLPSDWLVTIRQFLWLMSYDIVLKLHGHLYLCMSSDLCLIQRPGV